MLHPDLVLPFAAGGCHPFAANLPRLIDSFEPLNDFGIGIDVFYLSRDAVTRFDAPLAAGNLRFQVAQGDRKDTAGIAFQNAEITGEFCEGWVFIDGNRQRKARGIFQGSAGIIQQTTGQDDPE